MLLPSGANAIFRSLWDLMIFRRAALRDRRGNSLRRDSEIYLSRPRAREVKLNKTFPLFANCYLSLPFIVLENAFAIAVNVKKKKEKRKKSNIRSSTHHV